MIKLSRIENRTRCIRNRADWLSTRQELSTASFRSGKFSCSSDQTQSKHRARRENVENVVERLQRVAARATFAPLRALRSAEDEIVFKLHFCVVINIDHVLCANPSINQLTAMAMFCAILLLIGCVLFGNKIVVCSHVKLCETHVFRVIDRIERDHGFR